MYGTTGSGSYCKKRLTLLKAIKDDRPCSEKTRQIEEFCFQYGRECWTICSDAYILRTDVSKEEVLKETGTERECFKVERDNGAS